jgi:hypothetical protein
VGRHVDQRLVCFCSNEWITLTAEVKKYNGRRTVVVRVDDARVYVSSFLKFKHRYNGVWVDLNGTTWRYDELVHVGQLSFTLREAEHAWSAAKAVKEILS